MNRRKIFPLVLFSIFLTTSILISALGFIQNENYNILNNNVPKKDFYLEIFNNGLPSNAWNVTWGGVNTDDGNSVAIDGNNSVYICGRTSNFGVGNYDAFLVKYDPAGKQLWNTTWGGPNSDGFENIAVDGNNSLYLCGYTSSFGAGGNDAFLVKYDSEGNQLWNSTWGDIGTDYGNSIAVDGNNNAYLCGYTNSFGAGSYDAFLAKYDPAGNQLWNVTWGGSNADDGFGVAVDGNNNICICGDTINFGAGNYDTFIAKYDPAGNQLWNTTWGGSGWDFSNGIVVDGNNMIFLSGDTDSFGAGGNDAFLVKYDSAGNQLWNVTWGGSNSEYNYGITIDGNNSIYFCGETKSFGAGNNDAYLVKYNSEGYQLWNTTWGGSGDECGYGVAVDGINSIYLCGSTNSFGAGGLDAFLTKFEKIYTNLNSTSSLTWSGDNDDCGYDVAVDGCNNVYLCGYTDSFGAGGNDAFLAKYDLVGNQLWNVTWGGPNNERGRGVTVDGSNNVYLCGYTGSFGLGGYDAFLVKYDSAGNQLWNITWGNLGSDDSYGVAVDGNNSIYICGKTTSFGAGGYDAFLVKYDPAGNQLWNVTWGGANGEHGCKVAPDGNNNVYISGDTNTFGAGGYDAFLVKYDPAGNQLWNVTWGGSNDEISYGVTLDGTNNAYICGDTSSFGMGSADVFLVKYDIAGNQLWNTTWGGSNIDYGEGVAVDGANNIYLYGDTNSFGAGNYDVFLAKYDSYGNKLWNITWGDANTEFGGAVTIDGNNYAYICGYTNSFGSSGYDAFLVKYYYSSPSSTPSSSPFDPLNVLVLLINAKQSSPILIILLVVISISIILVGIIIYKSKSKG